MSGSGSGAPLKNPGFAGDVGDFDLTEEQVRGDDYVGSRPLDGGHPSVAGTLPYMLPVKNPEAPLFEGPYKERLEKIRTRYPEARAALLPALSLAQEIRGHVSPETMDRVAEILELPTAYVRGVATFYTMYNKRPVGRFLVQVCTNISCSLCGADDVYRAFLDATGTEPGETSADGEFTVMEVECLAACGFPTAIQVNSRYYENVTPDDVPALIERLKAQGS